MNIIKTTFNLFLFHSFSYSIISFFILNITIIQYIFIAIILILNSIFHKLAVRNNTIKTN